MNFRNLILGLVVLSAGCSPGYKIAKSNRAEYIIDKNVPADTSMLRLYLPYKQKLEAEMNQVIGYSEVLMPKVDTIPESLLGNFFSDAILQQGRRLDPDIDFAMPSTKGGIRIALPKGAIAVSNVFELMPFENALVVLTISGAETQQLLNFIAGSNGQPVAGLRMKIRDRKPEQVMINGKPFDSNRSYKVLTSDYVAGGGDNARGFKNPLEKKDLGLKVRDALLNYIRQQEAAGKKINSVLDGRITKN